MLADTGNSARKKAKTWPSCETSRFYAHDNEFVV